MGYRLSLHCFALLLTATLCAACAGEDSDNPEAAGEAIAAVDGISSPAKARARKKKRKKEEKKLTPEQRLLAAATAPVAWAPDAHVVRDFFDERLLFHVVTYGPYIDIGHPASVKYVQGRWKAPWHDAEYVSPEEAEKFGVPFLAGRFLAYNEGIASSLRFPIPEDLPRDKDYTLIIRFKPRANARVDIKLNDERVDSVPITPDVWQELTVNVPRAKIKFGAENELGFLFQSSFFDPVGRVAAKFDYVRLVPSDEADLADIELLPKGDLGVPGARILTTRRDALGIPAPARLDGYIVVPPRARLRFFLAPSTLTQTPVELAIDIRPDGLDALPETVFEATVKPGERWLPTEIDLSDYANQAVRLSIHTVEGGMGPSYGEAAVLLGEPQLVTLPEKKKKKKVRKKKKKKRKKRVRKKKKKKRKVKRVRKKKRKKRKRKKPTSKHIKVRQKPTDTPDPDAKPDDDDTDELDEEPVEEDKRIKRVVIFLVDSLRADRVVPDGGAHPATPHITALAEQGARFDVTASGTGSLIPTLSLFTGAHPQSHGVLNTETHLRTSFETLAEVAASAGFHAVYMTTNPYLPEGMGFGQGFAEYRNLFHETGPARTDRLVKLGMRAIKGNTQRPLFLVLHTAGLRLPHTPQDSSLNLFYSGAYNGRVNAVSMGNPITLDGVIDAADKQYLNATYDAELSEIDASIQEVVQTLEEAGGLDDTLLIIMGTHGEPLGEGNVVGYDRSLYPQTLTVPLVIIAPEHIEPGTLGKEHISTVDILPTLASFLGQPIPPTAQGRDISELLKKGIEAPGSRPLFARSHTDRELVGLQPYLYVLNSGDNDLLLDGSNVNSAEDVQSSFPIAHRASRDTLALHIAFVEFKPRRDAVQKAFEKGW